MGVNRIRGADTQRGAVAVELALVMPLLILLVMGIIDVGRIVFTQISVQDAAQEGALFAAYEPGDAALVEQRVHESVGDEGPLISNLTVNMGPTCDPTSTEITVSVSGTVELLTPFIASLLGDTIDLGRSITAPILVENCGS